MQTTVEDIVNFIDERKDKTVLARWTRDQICRYVWENIQTSTIRVAFDGELIIGVVIFNPDLRGKFWVNFLFGNCRLMWELLLAQMVKEYPRVNYIWAQRKGNRFVKFSVNKLIKIYGRRSSSTTT